MEEEDSGKFNYFLFAWVKSQQQIILLCQKFGFPEVFDHLGGRHKVALGNNRDTFSSLTLFVVLQPVSALDVLWERNGC